MQLACLGDHDTLGNSSFFFLPFAIPVRFREARGFTQISSTSNFNEHFWHWDRNRKVFFVCKTILKTLIITKYYFVRRIIPRVETLKMQKSLSMFITFYNLIFFSFSRNCQCLYVLTPSLARGRIDQAEWNVLPNKYKV